MSTEPGEVHIERPPLFTVTELLRDQNLEGPRRHIENAAAALIGEEPDFVGAAREAVLAVEGVAKVVAGKGATLGDCIKNLRNARVGRREFLNAIEALYAFRNAEPGLSHGAVDPPSTQEHEARFVVDAAAAAIRYLLALQLVERQQM